MEQKQYSNKWQKRFDFFEKYGSPSTPEFKTALKAASFGERLLCFFLRYYLLPNIRALEERSGDAWYFYSDRPCLKYY